MRSKKISAVCFILLCIAHIVHGEESGPGIAAGIGPEAAPLLKMAWGYEHS